MSSNHPDIGLSVSVNAYPILYALGIEKLGPNTMAIYQHHTGGTGKILWDITKNLDTTFTYSHAICLVYPL